MSAPVSRPPRSGGSLHATRQQLDELDALLQRMLDLPVQQAAEPEPEVAAEETVLPFRSAALERARAALAARLDRPAGAGQAAVPGYPPSPVPDAPPPVPPPPPPPPARGYPPSYLVVETAGSSYPPAAPAGIPGESPLGPRLVHGQEAAPPDEDYSNAHRDDGYRRTVAEPPAEADAPTGDWVPLRSSWQPSAQTWKPLAETWEQVRSPNPGMPAIPPPPPIPPLPPLPRPQAEMPVQPTPGLMPPLRQEGPSGPMVVTRQAPFHSLVEAETAESRLGATSSPPPLPRVPPPPSALPRIPQPPTAVVPPATPATLAPLVWFNCAFDLLLLPFGPAGRWLRRPGGRSLLGAVGLLCLAAAVVLALADRFGWTG